jgi:hypothetical protein
MSGAHVGSFVRFRSTRERRVLEQAILISTRSFSEQYEPTKDDLRRMLKEAVENTAKLQINRHNCDGGVSVSVSNVYRAPEMA